MNNTKRTGFGILCFLLLIICTFSLSACGEDRFNLSFIVDNETYQIITTNGKESIVIPQNPTKEGYTFEGWYWDENVWSRPFTENALLYYPISSDMSVYAKFTVKPSSGDNYENNGNSEHTHNLTHHASVASTCKKQGNIEYWSCSECNKNYMDADANTEIKNIAIVRIPHSYINGACETCGNSEPTGGLKYTINSDGTAYEVSGIETAAVTDVVIADAIDGIPVTSIDYSAFYECTKLTSITIPDSITSIGYDAFSYCTELTSITVERGNTVYHSVNNCLIETETRNLVLGCKNSIIPTDGSVTSIGFCAFNSCTGLKGITIPDSVMIIDQHAFSGCTGLTSITIPKSITSIGYSAFSGCTGLKAVHISDVAAWCNINFGGSFANPLDYAHNLYLNGSLLTDLVIPEGVKSIGNSLFSGSTGLKSITIPNSVISIGDSAFCNCKSLTSVKIGNSVTSIGYSAFKSCTGLTSIVIPNSVTSIGSSAFEYCTGLTNVIIPDNVISIGTNAFEDCRGLKSVIVGNNVTSIGERVFVGCTELESITIPFVGATKDGTNNTHFGYIFGASDYSYNSVSVPASLKNVMITGGSKVGERAFEGCIGLTNITMPNSVTSIGKDAFSGCTGLESITIPFVGAAKDGTNNTHFGYIFGASDYLFNSNFVPTSLENVIIVGGSSISDGAFCGCKGLTSITIPDSVTSIGISAFYNCTGLTSVTIPDSVTSIGNSAFLSCTGLASITIPNNVKSIADGTFLFCEKLSSITIGNSVTSIGNDAFGECIGLTSITIPDSVTSIGSSAFLGCKGLTSVTFTDTTTWYIDGTEISVTNASTNATYFTSTYYASYWYKE